MPAFCKAGATGRLLIEVQVELLGRWALLRREVGPPDGHSGVPAMSRASPARPLRLVFSPLSLGRRRGHDRLSTKNWPPRWSVAASVAVSQRRLQHASGGLGLLDYDSGCLRLHYRDGQNWAVCGCTTETVRIVVAGS